MIAGVVASGHVTAAATTAPTWINTKISDGNRNVVLPTGSGGLLVLTVALFTNSPAPSSGTVTPPTANVIPWTLRSFKGNTTVASWVFTKPAEAADPAFFSWTNSGSTGYQASSLTRYTHAGGVPTVNAVGTPLETTTTTPQFPAVTTTTANCVLFAYGSNASASWSSPGDGFTSITAWVAQQLYERVAAAAGTHGPTSVTLSGSAINDTHTIALAGY